MTVQFFDRLSIGILFGAFVIFISSCQERSSRSERVGVLSQSLEIKDPVSLGAQQIALYYPLLQGKKVGMVVNQTSMVDDIHLVDSLLKMNVDIRTIFSPEHGFRGEADAGEKILDGKDIRTGLPLISLYGKKKKPLPEDLDEIDIVVFDIQDVGARFYTYISTLHFIMEACAELNIPVIVLDRPNPNAHYIDGPVLEKEFSSFVGMHPVPIVYGMTIGEYALMINGEGWLDKGIKADLTVIENVNYTHDTFYELPVKPSPNLPNIKSILLYPSLCFFEGTNVSVGRGTDMQFQVYGHPDWMADSFVFEPVSMSGAKYPKHENKKCYGINLSTRTVGSIIDEKKLNLSYLISAYQKMKSTKSPFFLENNFFEKLAGTSALRIQLEQGLSEKDIRASWQKGIEDFKNIRSNYLLYD